VPQAFRLTLWVVLGRQAPRPVRLQAMKAATRAANGNPSAGA
jgi:hypothetical protein